MGSSQKKNPRFGRFLYLLDARHRRDKCMVCSAKPDYEVLWAEGMAHAWFCEKHLIEWLKESVKDCAEEGFSNKNCGVDSVKKLEGGEASKSFADNKNGNVLDSFLSKIEMPEVSKEKKKELEEEMGAAESKPIGLQDASIDAEVKDIHKVSGAESWNYLCTIKDGKRDVPIGRTYNTSIELNEGDIVKVEFANLNKYFDVKLKRGWYNWLSPRVLMARKDKKRPDNVDTADELVKASNGEVKNRRASIALDGDPYMAVPAEGKKILGMSHIHVRGKSVHIDLRFGVTKDWAVGWTLYIPKGLSKVPATFTEAKTLVDKEIMPTVKEKLKDPTQKFNCGTKAVEPIEWLDYQGRVEKGEVGATKNEVGYFYIIDRFDAVLGAQKPHYHEYFCDGKIFNGRFCVRLLENKEEWKKTGEGVMTWMASTALTDKTPYVLGRRAITKKWVPPYGHSALPEKIRSKVPKAYQYWNSRDPKKRLEIRDALIEEIKKTRINIDALGPVSFKVLKQTFKKQTVIREGPTRTRYFFVICRDGMQKLCLAFLNNPLEQNELAGIKTKDVKLCGYSGHENQVKPGTELNKTKATPSNIEVLEAGKATALVDRAVKVYKLKEGKMKGSWIMYNEEEGSAMWILKKIIRAS